MLGRLDTALVMHLKGREKVVSWLYDAICFIACGDTRKTLRWQPARHKAMICGRQYVLLLSQDTPCDGCLFQRCKEVEIIPEQLSSERWMVKRRESLRSLSVEILFSEKRV